MASKPRKQIQELIEELRSWLPNFDHGPNDYPTLLWRILASVPGGDRAEDMGYEPFNLGWHEFDQLGRVLVAVQDKRDVEDLIAGLLEEEEEEEVEEKGRRRGRRPPARARESRREYSMTYGQLPPFKQFDKDIRRPDHEHTDGRAYWPEGTLFPMELADPHEVELAEEYGGLQAFTPSRYAHKRGFQGDERAIYGFLEFLVSAWNEGDEEAGGLASSIMTVLGYEWI